METEIKLNASTLPSLGAIIQDPYLTNLLMPGSGQQIAMDSRYFDTPDGLLAAHGHALRLRTENESRIMTVKSGGPAGDGLHQRLEWSVELTSDDDPLANPERGFELDAFMRRAVSDGDPDDLLYDILHLVAGQTLVEVCQIVFTRQAYDIGYGDTLMELALDEGELRGGGQSAPLCELELELREGDARDLVALGEELAIRFGLVPENKSKLARCLALAGRRADPDGSDR